MLCLMMLTALAATAQSLSKLEYWFDQQVGSRQSQSLSGYEQTLNLRPSTSGLKQGLHWLHVRVLGSDGTYSGISSKPFIKANPSDGNTLEYWFDEDYENHATTDISAAGELTEISTLLDLRSIEQFPIGFHRLNFRVATASGQHSAVASAYVMRVGGGEANGVEYWVDDDVDHSRYAEGAPTGDGQYLILDQLDMTKVSPGLHRLYYRASSLSNRNVGAVSMAPIMVKSRYTTEADDLKVTAYRYRVEGEPDFHYYTLLDPKAELTISKEIDVTLPPAPTRARSTAMEGDAGNGDQNILEFQVISSNGTHSETKTKAFTYNNHGNLLMELIYKAQHDGVVYIETVTTFNMESVELHLVRKNPYGGSSEIKQKVSRFKNQLIWTDMPPVIGQYTYQASIRFQDNPSDPSHYKTITSDPISVSLEKVADNKSNRSVTGTLEFFQFKNRESRELKVVCTDQNGVQQTTYTKHNKFTFEGLEEDLLVQFQIEDDVYECEKVLIRVKPQNDPITLKTFFKADAVDDVNSVDDILYVDEFYWEKDKLKAHIGNTGKCKFRGKLAFSALPIIHDPIYSSYNNQKKIISKPTELDRSQAIPMEALVNVDWLPNYADGMRKYVFFLLAQKEGENHWWLVEPMRGKNVTNPLLLDFRDLTSGENKPEQPGTDVEDSTPATWTNDALYKAVTEVNNYLKSACKIENIIGYGSVVSNGPKEAGIRQVFHEDLIKAIQTLTPGTDPMDAVRKFYAHLTKQKGLGKLEQLFKYYHQAWTYIQSAEGQNNFFAQLIRRYLDINADLAKKVATFDTKTFGSTFDNRFVKDNTYSKYNEASNLIFFNEQGSNIAIGKISDAISSISVYAVSTKEHTNEESLNVNTTQGDVTTVLAKKVPGIRISSLDRTDNKNNYYILCINWQNGRTSYFPLLLDEDQGMTKEEGHLPYDPPIVNIGLRSLSSQWGSTTADYILLQKP